MNTVLEDGGIGINVAWRCSSSLPSLYGTTRRAGAVFQPRLQDIDCNCPGQELVHSSLVFEGSICLVLYFGLAGDPFPFTVPGSRRHDVIKENNICKQNVGRASRISVILAYKEVRSGCNA